MKKLVLLTIVGAVSLLLVSGCSWLKGYGKVRVLPREEAKLAIGGLKEKWEDYSIYYAGLKVGTAAAVMFDPKSDKRTLIGDKWIRVEDQGTLLKLISVIESYIQCNPRLYRILGPDNQLYGYIFYAWCHPVIKLFDDRTLYVYDIESPAYMPDGPSIWWRKLTAP